MKTVFILNGPNLNLLGQREPATYGHQTLDDVRKLCSSACDQHRWHLDFRQSNHEGDLIDWIHEAGALQTSGKSVGVILNAGAYTHTSIALPDAVKGAQVTLIELHISNVHAREPFRQHSYLSAVAAGVMCGFGTYGYVLALAALANMSQADPH